MIPRGLAKRPGTRTRPNGAVARRAARLLAGALVLAAALSAGAPGRAGACVGRTLYVGYHDTPEQALAANILAVFIDERTGTTVKLARFGTRDEAFAAIRDDKVSLYVDHAGIVLGRFGGESPGPDAEKTVARVKEVLNRKYNIVWLESVGFDQAFSGTDAGGNPGPAGLMLCKDALAKFPALPKLLGKLRGALDNGTMAGLLREAKQSDLRSVARRFLKSRKLI